MEDELKEAKGRLTRWEEIRRGQLSLTNNLLLTFSVAILGFAVKEYFGEFGHLLLWWGCFFLLLSVLCAIVLSFSRLFDYKFTADTVRLEVKAIEDGRTEKLMSKIRALKMTNYWLGRLSWLLLGLQAVFFILGCFVIMFFISQTKPNSATDCSMEAEHRCCESAKCMAHEKSSSIKETSLQIIVNLDSLPLNGRGLYKLPSGETKIINHTPAPPLEEEADESSFYTSESVKYQYASLVSEKIFAPENKNCDAAGCPDHCEFDGKKRKEAKTTISKGTIRTYATVTEFLTKFADKHPDVNMPDIIAKNDKRVPLEDFNITITKAWLFCFAKETDEDYHLVIGTKKDINDPTNRFMIVEISGLPEAGGFKKKLSKVQDDFFQIIGEPICNSGYYWFDEGNDPEPITVTGSAYWDIEHWSKKNQASNHHGPTELKKRLTTVWEIHPITSIGPAN